MAAVFLLLGVFYAVFSKGSGAEGVWESVVGLVKRATSSTTSTSNSSPFVQNKLYLIVAIVGFVVVVILALMLSAWCCRGAFFFFVWVMYLCDAQDRLRTRFVALVICVRAVEVSRASSALVVDCAPLRVRKWFDDRYDRPI
ncbi:hypothetical protein M378DRAFT_16024 [Amanita muscaria Koide BX008]|uniref:Uncharacterized protein n=1 Tax=Amanita muscaria (strain Koide BX008) TaxID=946122 RepID=A0A0C2S4Y4_AMAMK|nr:hypothetical protein M378DRAFT_16024 [Amanita muscaria Koide BX008]